ncbi:alpha,alpha-trehalose-phosphate synthase (UDP-forming) [Luteimonas sp. RIT-PG2_3]
MSRLVVVSNRVALPGESRAGGLALGLDGALKERGGLWFGWSGRTVQEDSGALHEQVAGDIRYITMDLSRADHADYYNGFSNRTLWPLLHFRLDLVDYSRETREGYRRVNALFADRLAPLLRSDDTVWIHDYHLIPLGFLLRERGIDCRIGFFLHVPMPSADLVAALPDHARLFTALYAYDLVGLQTARDVDRFRSYVRLFGGGGMVDDDTVQAPGGRRLRVGAFPIGIDPDRIQKQAASAMAKPAVRALATSLEQRALAIGVDRLDYSKGLPERFHAFQRFLERHPAERGRMTYLQIAPVSRGDVDEYRQLRDELEQIAGHVNGTHAEPDWTPLRYVNRNFAHATLTGFYRLAKVALVTPLRDGMNLVAKEYVAAQDPEDPGVLVLSMLAGAAHELDSALLVNPYDLDGVADAIARAGAMPLKERKERWAAMMERIERNDIHAWCSRFLAALESSHGLASSRACLPVPGARSEH